MNRGVGRRVNPAMCRTHAVIPCVVLLMACSERAPTERTPATAASAPVADPAPATEPVADAPFCPELVGLSTIPPNDASTSLPLATVRATKQARSADLMKCAGVESVWLARTDAGDIALMAWVAPKKPGQIVMREENRSHTPRYWLDGAPLLLWEKGPCTLEQIKPVIVLPVPPGAVRPPPDRLELIEKLATRPEWPDCDFRVAGSAKGTPGKERSDRALAVRRADEVVAFLRTRNIAARRQDPDPTSYAATAEDRVAVTGCEPKHYCGGQWIFFE